MSQIRPLWFETHLLSSAGGKAARRRCEALGPARHEDILALGDSLANDSIAAAQEFYRSAAAATEAFGGGFERWVNLGAALAQGEVPLREAAVAFFRVEPERARAVGLDGLERWSLLAREVAGVSRKLAATFCETTGPLLGRLDLDTLAAWARQGAQLHGQHGWHGEFLAQSYLAAAPHALPLLAPPQFPLWAGLGAAVRRAMKEAEFYRALPEVVGEWSDAERNAYLRTALALAIDNPRVAVQFYLEAPRSIQPLPAHLRGPLLQACALSAKRAGRAHAELIPVLGAVVLDIPAEARGPALDLALAVAQRFPAALPSMLRSLPRAFEEGDLDAVRVWVERGLALAAERIEVGLAYFALESRTSLKILRASSTAVTVEEVQGVLRKYVQMLSGEPAVLHSVNLFQLRPPLEEFPAENEVALPLRIDALETHEDNERLYRVLAAQVAGRREFGTYGWEGEGDAAGRPPGSALVTYLRDEERPELVEEVFLIAEGYRVICRLVREYPGLAGEFRWAAEEMLRRWRAMAHPPEEVVFDAVLAAALLGAEVWAVEAPDWLVAAADVILPALVPLAAPASTVADALALAERLTALLLEAGARRRARQDQWEFGGLLLEKGDALLDPYYDEEDQTPFDGEAPAVPASRAPEERMELPEGTQIPLEHDEDAAGSRPLSLAELQRLLESGVDLKISQAKGDEVDGLGLYITDLAGKVPSEQLEELRRLLGDGERTGKRAARGLRDSKGKEPVFLYDEWDYHLGDYRPRWCQLREIGLEGDSGLFFNQTLDQYAGLIPEIRRQFQRIRPEMYRMVRGLEDGEDFDLNAAVNARIEARARRTPSHKLYVARKREERDVATLFLLDMSASTDEPLEKAAPAAGSANVDDLLPRRPTQPRPKPRRIIDVTKEALVIMAQALEEIGDTYAIYGFSGHGRESVEFYLVKSFTEPLTAAVKGRIGGIEPKRSTRMGAALRHAVDKMSAVASASKHLILLSDGFPQDFDYGQDRRSNVYGIRDTTAALRECEGAGITPFCITVDKSGHDYLREMCESSRYMVIEDMASLPKELPKIYQRVVWSAA
jgi:hypothetical protein